MNKTILLSSIIALSILLSFSMNSSFAHPHPGQIMIDGHSHESQTEIIPLGGMIGLEKSTVFFHTPETNSLPWGFVEGKIANPVEGYPVIIQIYQEGEAAHFAQTSVSEDGNYEYKFRVLNVEGEKTTKIFDGAYHVIIFKVVYLDQSNSL